MTRIADLIPDEPPVMPLSLDVAKEAEATEGGGGLGFDMGFLLKPTGPGDIEDYLQHPLNPRKSKGLAQALRGATGLFGDGLRAALADILFGGMEYMRERRTEVANVSQDT